MSPVELWHGDVLELAANLPSGINCVICDPPYGINFRSRRAVTPEGKKWARDISGDQDLKGAISLFQDAMAVVLPKTMDPCELYVFTRWDIVGEWITAVRALSEYGFTYKALLIWAKGFPGQGDIDCNWGCGHELILYCKRGRREIPHRRSGIISVDKLGPKQHIHPSEKPVGLIEKLLEMSTDPGDLVVDPFAGSASTLVAAKAMGRRAIGIEKDGGHFRAASERLQQGTFAF